MGQWFSKKVEVEKNVAEVIMDEHKKVLTVRVTSNTGHVKDITIHPYFFIQAQSWYEIVEAGSFENDRIPTKTRLEVATLYADEILAAQKVVEQATKQTQWSKRWIESHKKYLHNIPYELGKVLRSYIAGSFMGGHYGSNHFCPRGQAYSIRSVVLQTSPHERKVISKLRKRGIRIQSNEAWLEKTFDRLMYIITHAPVPEKKVKSPSITVWRGMKLNQAFSPGSLFAQPTFMSTSLLRSMALGFAGVLGQDSPVCCIFEMKIDLNHIPALAIMDSFTDMAIMRNEYEILIPPCFLRITKERTALVSDWLNPLEQKSLMWESLLNKEVRVLECEVVMPKKAKWVSQAEGHCYTITAP